MLESRFSYWLRQLFKKKTPQPTPESPTIQYDENRNTDDPERRRALEILKERHLCTVRPHKRLVYDFRKRRHVKLRRWGFSDDGFYDGKKTWPLIGYACPECKIFDNYRNHYLVDRRSLCVDCAIDELLKGTPKCKKPQHGPTAST